MSILIVEDSNHMRRVLSEYVRSAFPQHVVVEAADAKSARRLCENAAPALVLMDVGLPDASGIDLTAEIRYWWPEARIIVVSNHRYRASVDAAQAAGAVAYVFKDEVYEKLVPAMRSILDPLAT